MSLQYKISALLLAVFTLFGIFTYAVQHHVILPNYLALETREARAGMARVEQAIQRELAALAQPADDWAAWNESYRFLADRNAQFRDTELTRSEVFEQLRVDLLYVIDTFGDVIWSAVYDRHSGAQVTLPELDATHIPSSHPLLPQFAGKTAVDGLMMTSAGPLLVASRPSLDSNAQGPSHGTLVFGRFLDGSTLKRIARQAGVKLDVWSLQGAELDAGRAAIVAELDATGAAVVRADDTESYLYQAVPDVFGRPALVLQVTTPRLMSVEGGIVNEQARTALAVGALLILLVLLVGLRRLVLSPIADLIRHAGEVGRHDDLTLRLDTRRSDEIGDLACEFNDMVERLAEARKALEVQSHQAGIAELASGVLHNIGNAITPIKVRVANIEGELRAAPVAELEMALQELDDAHAPAERRVDLRQFIDLAAREFGALLNRSAEQIGGIARQVDHVQKILNDQESVSRANRVLRPVDIARVAADAVKLLGDEVLKSLQVDIDPSVRAVDKVMGSPVALQQVVVNLLKNSAESIRSCSPPPLIGRITVSATVEKQAGRDMIGLRVTDNGGGIAAENLSRVFERGYTTKSRPTSGRGMHWCSITATALGGLITIDSPGLGQGATVALWLPQA